MSTAAISFFHRLLPTRRVSARAPQPRRQILEQSLIKLSREYKLKPDNPPRHTLYIESQLDNLEEGKASDYFNVTPQLVSTVVKQARELSGQSTPIVLDIGGGACSSHRRFAEAGMISVCIDPAAEVLEKAAHLLGMRQMAEGVWKDPELDHYLVVGDAQTAAEIFGMDQKHPRLKPLAGQKQDILARLISIGRNFDPAKIDSSLFPESLKDIAECEEKLRRFDQGDEAILAELNRNAEERAKRWRSEYKPLSRSEARKELTKNLEQAQGWLRSEKLEHYLEAYQDEIELLIGELRSLDDRIEEERIRALNSAQEPPLVDLVFSGYMPADVDLTPAIKGILAKGIIYISESGGATGIPNYEELTKFKYISKGFYNHSYLRGKSYVETTWEYIREQRKITENYSENKRNVLMIQIRKDRAPALSAPSFGLELSPSQLS